MNIERNEEIVDPVKVKAKHMMMSAISSQIQLLVDQIGKQQEILSDYQKVLDGGSSDNDRLIILSQANLQCLNELLADSLRQQIIISNLNEKTIRRDK